MKYNSNETYSSLTEEFERSLTIYFLTGHWGHEKPYRRKLGTYWKRWRKSFRDEKREQSRRERRRARINPECVPFYGKHCGWFW